MAMVANPRFPHSVRVFSSKIGNNGEELYDERTGESLTEDILLSVCGLRDMSGDSNVDIEVMKADYKLALPKTSTIVRFRDKIEFTNSYTGEVVLGEVKRCRVTNFGTNIWFQSNGNKNG